MLKRILHFLFIKRCCVCQGTGIHSDPYGRWTPFEHCQHCDGRGKVWLWQ